MKVDSTTNSNLPTLKDAVSRTQPGDASTASATTAQSAATTTSQSTGSQSGDASVSLSGLSQHLLSQAGSGSGDIDTAHVASIKQAIANGTLQIDSSKIADGVLQTARDLLQNKTSSTGN